MNFNFAQALTVPNKTTSDPWYGKLILRVYGTNLPFKVGDVVTIDSPLYKGMHKIGYIYKGTSVDKGSYYNLYFQDLKFIGNTAGTIDSGSATTTKAATLTSTATASAPATEVATTDEDDKTQNLLKYLLIAGACLVGFLLVKKYIIKK